MSEAEVDLEHENAMRELGIEPSGDPDWDRRRVHMTYRHGMWAPGQWNNEFLLFDLGPVPSLLGAPLERPLTKIVSPLMFTAFVGVTDNLRTGYIDRWCYHSMPDALAAAEAWDPDTQPEPAGWHRHPGSGRRRPDGDPSKEYIEW